MTPTGNAPLRDLEPVVERPRAHLAIEWRQPGGLLERHGDRLHARVVQPQPVERARVEPPLGRCDVLGVGGEHVAARLPDESRGAVQRLLHGGVLDTGERQLRSGRLLGDESRHSVVGRHAGSRFTLYCFATGRANTRSASGEVEGTGPMTPRQPAPAGHGAKPASCGSNDGERPERNAMPASHLRCTQCGTERPLEGVSACDRCFAPLEPVYDVTSLTPRGDRVRPAVAVAVRAAAPRGAAGARIARARVHAARRRAPPRGRARHRRALPQARHRQPDALVQGPRRRGRVGEGAGARPRGARLRVHREPRERRCGARCRRGPAGGDLLPGRRRAREAACQRCARGDHLRRPRQLRRLQPADDRALLRAAVGVRQRDPARLLRRGLEDARVRDRPSSSAGSCPTSSPSPLRRGRCCRGPSAASRTSCGSVWWTARRRG